MPHRLPQALLLDLDNTVYPYDPCHLAGMDASARCAAALHTAWRDAFRFEDEYRQARANLKLTAGGQGAEHCRLLYFKKMVERKLGRTDLTAIHVLHSAYWSGYFMAMVIDPGCHALMERARAAGMRIAWITNFTTERQILKLRTLGLEKAADFLVTSEEAGADKPSPAVFRMALELLGVAASDAVVIGDDLENDVRPAIALGMRTIWLRRDSSRLSPKDSGPAAASWDQIALMVFGKASQAA